MEQEPKKEIGLPVFKVVWHSEIKKDLSRLPPSLTDSIVRAVDQRLSRAPQMIGEPLKGTTKLLWKIRFSMYRVVYTINERKKEVWVLSVQKRDVVYRDRHVQSLLKLAVALHQQMEQSRSK